MRINLSHTDSHTWNSMISGLPGAHILQTWEWAQLKKAYGWSPHPISWQDENGTTLAAAMILVRSLPMPWKLAGLRVIYVPKGPLCDWENPALRQQVLQDLEHLARQQKAIFVKIDPDICLGKGFPGSDDFTENAAGLQVAAELEASGWQFSQEQVQFRNTVLIDLSLGEEALLANMKQKTRYNARLASRKGVVVREGSEQDFPLLFQMYAETSIRDGFVIRNEAYYLNLWQTFREAGMLLPLVAEVDGQMVGGLMLFFFAGKAWYLHGMSAEAHREKMPNYLLQWVAMQKAIERGCLAYDLWGAPDRFDGQDPLWGVYRFKEGLGGSVVRYIGAWDLPLRPGHYQLYTRLLPQLLAWMRHLGRARTRAVVTDQSH